MRSADEEDARKENDSELVNSVSFSDAADDSLTQADTRHYFWDRVLESMKAIKNYFITILITTIILALSCYLVIYVNNLLGSMTLLTGIVFLGIPMIGKQKRYIRFLILLVTGIVHICLLHIFIKYDPQSYFQDDFHFEGTRVEKAYHYKKVQRIKPPSITETWYIGFRDKQNSKMYWTENPSFSHSEKELKSNFLPYFPSYTKHIRSEVEHINIPVDHAGDFITGNPVELLKRQMAIVLWAYLISLILFAIDEFIFPKKKSETID